MRLITLVSLIVLLITSIVPTALAATSVDLVIDQESFDFAKDKIKVEQGINTSKLKPKEFLVKHKNQLARKELDPVQSSEQLVDGKPFKVIICNKTLVKALLNKEKLSNVITNTPYHWEVPVLFKDPQQLNVIKPVASYTVDILESKWQVVEVGGYLSPDFSEFSSNPKNIAALFKNNGIKEANKFAHIRIPSLHMDILYMESNNQEYFVPLLHSRDELYGLKNKQLYAREQLVSAVEPILKQGLVNPNFLAGAPNPNKSLALDGNTNIYIGIAVVIIGVIALYYLKRIYSSKSNS